MAHGHKFAKLKYTNHQNLAIRQNLAANPLYGIIKSCLHIIIYCLESFHNLYRDKLIMTSVNGYSCYITCSLRWGPLTKNVGLIPKLCSEYQV